MGGGDYMNYIKKNLVYILLAFIAGIVLAFMFWAPKVGATQNDNVTICHATGSNNNPYVKITVDDDAVDGNGNSDHNRSGHQNGEDIIPPGYWDQNGRNWDAEGQAIYNNNCNIPEPKDYCDTLPGVQKEDEDCPPIIIDPCDVELKRSIVEVDPCEEPEVTPTPEQPKEPSNPPVFAGSSTGTPQCGDSKPSNVANINVTVTGNKGELEVQWALPTGGDRVHIEYGLEQNAQHALLNTPNDGNEVIRDLVSGKHYWFRVMAVNGCAVGDPSIWFDPIVP